MNIRGVVASLAILLVACDGPASSLPCIPSATLPCACDGSVGARMCTADAGYGACVCPAATNAGDAAADATSQRPLIGTGHPEACLTGGNVLMLDQDSNTLFLHSPRITGGQWTPIVADDS